MSLRAAGRPCLIAARSLSGSLVTVSRLASLARPWEVDQAALFKAAPQLHLHSGLASVRASHPAYHPRTLDIPWPFPRSRRAYTTASSLGETAADLARTAKRERRRLHRLRRLPLFAKILTGITAFLLVSVVSYETVPPSRHFLLALVRCSRLLRAVVLDVLDYKWTFAKRYPAEMTAEEEKQARRVDRHACHARSAQRMLEALKTNAGIYVVGPMGTLNLCVTLTDHCATETRPARRIHAGLAKGVSVVRVRFRSRSHSRPAGGPRQCGPCRTSAFRRRSQRSTRCCGETWT